MKLIRLAEGQIGERKTFYCSRCQATTPHTGTGDALWKCDKCQTKKVDVRWMETEKGSKPELSKAEIVGLATGS
ncbi:MAG: hypothetical protein Q8K86_11500 [Candidatus Nanopelagicaceae bacterium]|nr:hypothetical protein [Candidatus Nanopelagicaceae bacterium]